MQLGQQGLCRFSQFVKKDLLPLQPGQDFTDTDIIEGFELNQETDFGQDDQLNAILENVRRCAM